MDNITQTDWAYLAGFMDGEGSFSIVRCERSGNRSGFRYSPHSDVANTHRKVMDNLYMKFGGNIKISKRNQKNINHKDLYRLYFSPNKLREIIPNLLPYLIVKRRQAEICLQLLKINEQPSNYSYNRDKEKHGLWSELMLLNRRKYKINIPEFQGLRDLNIEKIKRFCTYPECSNKYYAKGYCRHHYRKLCLYPEERNRRTEMKENVICKTSGG